jgi:hypothetical protein
VGYPLLIVTTIAIAIAIVITSITFPAAVPSPVIIPSPPSASHTRKFLLVQFLFNRQRYFPIWSFLGMTSVVIEAKLDHFLSSSLT